jgi:S-DNA-T family DNA segregation ATPase FtsK/SpoIIIE
MAEDGIVGPYNGSQAREVLISLDEWDAMNGRTPAEQSSPPRHRRSNKILLEGPEEDPPESDTETAPWQSSSDEYEEDEVEDEEEEYEYEDEDTEEEPDEQYEDEVA